MSGAGPVTRGAAPMPELERSAVIHSPVTFGIDFGSASLAAARWATRLVAPDSATLVHVAETKAERELAPALTGGLGGFAATLAVENLRTVVRVGSPSHWLPAVADEAGASLLVLGRRNDARRVRVGERSVLERAARRTSASVLVVPEGVQADIGCVIAPVDESACATAALDSARRIARAHEVPLVVLHVLSSATQAHARWLVELGDWHVVRGSDRTEIAMGDPVRETLAAASRVSSPLIVVGARGSDGAPEGSLGSVARELAMRATAPVLLVRRHGSAA